MKPDDKVSAIQLAQTSTKGNVSKSSLNMQALKHWFACRNWDLTISKDLDDVCEITVSHHWFTLTTKYYGDDCWIVDFYGCPVVMSNKNYQSWQKAQS